MSTYKNEDLSYLQQVLTSYMNAQARTAIEYSEQESVYNF
jgi:hypothetical protein